MKKIKTCQHWGYFWPVSKKGKYIEHCGNCRNYIDSQCLLEMDPRKEPANLLLAMTQTETVQQAVGMLIEGVLRKTDVSHWLRLWYALAMRNRLEQTMRLASAMAEAEGSPPCSEIKS